MKSESRNIALTAHERLLTFSILFLSGVTAVFDIIAEIKAGIPPTHYVAEMIVSTVAIGVAIWILTKFLVARRGLQHAQTSIASSNESIARLKSDREFWKNQTTRFTDGLSSAINLQFKRWSLSSAEAEVANLLLKGFSTKEIAELRVVSDRTVRQQTGSIYDKSGLGGRAELSAFFLEDLLSPTIHDRDLR